MPRILSVNPESPDPHVVQEVLKLLKADGLVALPTDTLYGLTADIFSEAALERLVALKARPHDKPIPIFISRVEALEMVAAAVPDAARRLAQEFWPGPLTLILHASPDIPEMITAGTGTVGVRIPQLRLIAEILEAMESPLTGTSANKSGGIHPVTVKDVLGSIGNKVDLLVDGGKARGGVASTVLDCTQSPFQIIREGSITGEALAAVLEHGDLAPS
jgi:L-threonylcarbamoyladenylate synthase